jgi:arylsulfatase
MSWPGHFAQGLRSDALVELTDVVPTLLECVGLPIPERVMGRSLLPILTQRADPSSHRDFVRCEYHDALALEHASHANMIVDERYKLVVYHGQDLGELYDLQEDPHEFENLWDDPAHAEIRFTLMKRLFDAVMQATDPGQPRVGRF